MNWDVLGTLLVWPLPAPLSADPGSHFAPIYVCISHHAQPLFLSSLPLPSCCCILGTSLYTWPGGPCWPSGGQLSFRLLLTAEVLAICVPPTLLGPSWLPLDLRPLAPLPHRAASKSSSRVVDLNFSPVFCRNLGQATSHLKC